MRIVLENVFENVDSLTNPSLTDQDRFDHKEILSWAKGLNCRNTMSRTTNKRTGRLSIKNFMTGGRKAK
jgi:hypothetical protein